MANVRVTDKLTPPKHYLRLRIRSCFIFFNIFNDDKWLKIPNTDDEQEPLAKLFILTFKMIHANNISRCDLDLFKAKASNILFQKSSFGLYLLVLEFDLTRVNARRLYSTRILKLAGHSKRSAPMSRPHSADSNGADFHASQVGSNARFFMH